MIGVVEELKHTLDERHMRTCLHMSGAGSKGVPGLLYAGSCAKICKNVHICVCEFNGIFIVYIYNHFS